MAVSTLLDICVSQRNYVRIHSHYCTSHVLSPPKKECNSSFFQSQSLSSMTESFKKNIIRLIMEYVMEYVFIVKLFGDINVDTIFNKLS